MKTSTLFLLVAVVGGTFQNQDKIIDLVNPPPAISQLPGSYSVILYSTMWCGYCAKTRQYFADNNIQYTDLDVEHSERGRSDYKSLVGNGVPIVVINNKITIHGYNPKKIRAALSNTNNP